MSTSPVEIEVKIKLFQGDTFPALLLENGYAVTVPRVFESNVIVDSADKKMRSQGTVLRVRTLGNRGLLTWKGPKLPGPHKARVELESAVDDPSGVTAILQALGYSAQFRYEKYRTEFRLLSAENSGVVTYDETPIGRYLELEGSSDWIDSAASTLGFGPSRYVLESYASLYESDCRRRGIKPTNMVFATSS